MENSSSVELFLSSVDTSHHETSPPEHMIRQAEDLSPVGVLRSNQFAMPPQLTAKQRGSRTNLLGWWIGNAKDSLLLRNRTIDIAIRIFDLYCYKKNQSAKNAAELSKKNSKTLHTLDNSIEGKLTAAACFFSAAKYNEVYPPSLSNFIYNQEDCLTRQAVIQKQFELVAVINCRYNIALITDWFELYSQFRIPSWTYYCYLYAPYVKSEELAMAILEVVESTSRNQETSQYIQEVLGKLKIEVPNFMKRHKSGKKALRLI